jgi:hypothetical protein
MSIELYRRLKKGILQAVVGKGAFSPNVFLRRKILFVHVPKNAGSSVYRALGRDRSTHAELQWYKDNLNPFVYKAIYKFAFVRNPFDRFLSLYNYARMEQSMHHSSVCPDSALHGKHRDYDKLKNASLYECAQMLQAGQLEHDEYYNQWRPQHVWLDVDRGEGVNFIGRFEKISEDFSKIAINIGARHQISKTNESKRVNYRDEFDERTRAVVQDYYKEDLKRFGYRF